MTGSLAADESGGAERRFQSPAIDAGVFQQAVACANHGVILVSAVSPDMPIVYANDAFLGMTGYTLPEVSDETAGFCRAATLRSRKSPRFAAQLMRGNPFRSSSVITVVTAHCSGTSCRFLL
jgi:hypothetical protein